MVTAVKRIEANQSTSLCVDTSATIVQALPVYESSPSHQAYFGEGGSRRRSGHGLRFDIGQ